MLKLYDDPLSGNGYKVRLLLAHLGRGYEYRRVDILAGETRTPAFLEKNPDGRVPVLELEDGRFLAQSNAILWYLAEDGPFAPDGRWARADALRWMFFEQYSHEPYIAVLRFWAHLGEDLPPAQAAQVPERRAKGYQALEVMQRHLADTPFFGGGKFGIADIALYAYTHVAHEGGFDLSAYPAVRDWMDRVAAQPGHIPMNDLPRAAHGLAAGAC
ncbi:MAG: glutathione S-transferase family protein [Rhodovibrionaceae bacterium]|nr:glutathione S-transferase family protein [Rhodovibrionaceae bacterium]